MGYRKFKADSLFTGREILEKDLVLITDEQGTISGLIPPDQAGEGVQEFTGMLCPGLINCHCHLELSHLRGIIPKGKGLTDFVFQVVTQRHFPEEVILEAISRAENEMLASGIVAVGDICNNSLSLPQKQKQRLYYYNFIEVSGWVPQMAKGRFEKSWHSYEEFSQLPNGQHRLAMTPHAPYSISEELWSLLIPCFENKTTSIHNQETQFEDELFKKGTGGLVSLYEKLSLVNPLFKPSGKSSLQTYLPWLDQAKQILLVHNTFTREEDLRFCQSRIPKLFFCLCVNANRYIENAMPDLEALRKYGCRIVLGTDSLASNESLSILEEIKTILRQFPDLPTAEVLQWATVQGAQALELDHQLGSFESGKKPGIILIENISAGVIQENSSVKRLL